MRSCCGVYVDAGYLPLLRMHWYDAALSGVPDPSQRSIATLPRVKLRLGRTVHGEHLSTRLGVDELDDAIRHRLRNLFQEHVQRR